MSSVSTTTTTAIIKKSVEIDLGLDTTDTEIILLVMKGRRSAYSVWTTMKKESREKNLDIKVMTYRNINKRVIKLAKLGLIEEETKLDVHAVNIHGRKDYKITTKGLECLIPHMMAYPEDVKNIIEHMDKFGVDKKVIGDLLKDRVRTTFESVNQFLRFMELPEIGAIYSKKRAAEMRLLRTAMTELDKELKSIMVVKPKPKSESEPKDASTIFNKAIVEREKRSKEVWKDLMELRQSQAVGEQDIKIIEAQEALDTRLESKTSSQSGLVQKASKPRKKTTGRPT